MAGIREFFFIKTGGRDICLRLGVSSGHFWSLVKGMFNFWVSFREFCRASYYGIFWGFLGILLAFVVLFGEFVVVSFTAFRSGIFWCNVHGISAW